MKPAPFAYARPESAPEVTALLAEHGDEARILAGGLSLLPMLNLRLARPALVVDIAAVGDLVPLSFEADGVRIGAQVTQAAALANGRLLELLPILGAALGAIGHYQTRARGTICGSAAHADPSAEIPLVLCLLGARVGLRSATGLREVDAVDFFCGPLVTDCGDGEWLEWIFIPTSTAIGSGFEEVRLRHGDFAVVACGVLADADGVSIGVGGVNDVPWVGRWPRAALADPRTCVSRLLAELDFDAHVREQAEYRRHLVSQLVPHVVASAMGTPG